MNQEIVLHINQNLSKFKTIKLSIIYSYREIARPKFELGLTVPETVVLPLDDLAISMYIIPFLTNSLPISNSTSHTKIFVNLQHTYSNRKKI